MEENEKINEQQKEEEQKENKEEYLLQEKNDIKNEQNEETTEKLNQIKEENKGEEKENILSEIKPENKNEEEANINIINENNNIITEKKDEEKNTLNNIDQNLLINDIKNESKKEKKEEKEEKIPIKNEIKEEENLLIDNILIEKTKEDHYLLNDKNSINEINEENKNDKKEEEIKCNKKEDTNHIIKEKKDIIIKKEIKEELDVNSKEYIKLKSVLLNSFTLEKKQEKQEEKKDIGNDFISVEKNEQEFEEMMNNAYKKEKCNEIYKYKDLNAKKKIKKFHLFSSECENLNERKTVYKFGKILVYTYRKNFPKITNYKTKKTYTTDAWWGCMVRCGQMILSRGIYRLLKSTGMNTKSSIYFTSSLFCNYPIQTNFLHQYFQGMIKKYKTLSNFDENGDSQIKEFYPPFSIKTLCDVGELFERTAGEWFSDVIITGIFKKISYFFELFNHPKLNAQVMTYQSCIDIPDILQKCFVEKKKDKDNKKHIHFNKKYYYFEKMGIVFVNVRVGLDKIPKEYYPGIKKLFDLKECIGIVGGKTRLAYYFIGYVNDSEILLYLDPHVSKEAHKIIFFKMF